jgi:RNA polymerase sigma factor (sigma-70 family)
MSEDKLLARMRAVKRIARRAGYPEHTAEDISQHVAINALKGRKVETQSNHQSFVDAVREGGERAYNRRGEHVVPIYEHQFERDNFNEFIALFGFEGSDHEERDDHESNLFAVVSAIAEIERSLQRIVILYFCYGWTLDRISKRERVSESRISQKLARALQSLKKTVIQSRVSQEKQRERKLEEHRALSQEIQAGPESSGSKAKSVETIREEQRFGVDAFEVQEIPEEICRPFAVAAF